jgi:hypothetical protein
MRKIETASSSSSQIEIEDSSSKDEGQIEQERGAATSQFVVDGWSL